MLKMSYAGCPGLSLAIAAQFTLKMCVVASASNTDDVWQYRYFGIQERQYRYTGIDTGILFNDSVNEKILI